MKKELLMSMLARNARRIVYMEIEINDCKFWKDYQSIDRYKKEISKLAEIQKAIKVELRGQLKYPKKHGKNDIRFLLWVSEKTGKPVQFTSHSLKG